MKPRLAQRELALAGTALLAAAVALAVTTIRHESDGSLPRPEGSYVALAGSSGPGAFGRRTACGLVIKPDTEGVAHPTLQCGARIYVVYREMHVLTQVIDRGPYVPGRTFDLTDALARRLELRGVKPIHWSYASVQ